MAYDRYTEHAVGYDNEGESGTGRVPRYDKTLDARHILCLCCTNRYLEYWLHDLGML